jgi:hypothetical protein
MPTAPRRPGRQKQPAEDAEPGPETGQPDAAASEKPDTGLARRLLSRSEQERLRRKLREKFH